MPDLSHVLFIYINMDKSIHRRANMEKQFAETGFNFRRFIGIDGEEIYKTFSESKKERYLKAHGREIRPGEIGCYYSHLGAMNFFLNTDYSHAVIMEDDALFVDNAEQIQIIMDQKYCDRWDFLRLQSRRKYRKLSMGILEDNLHLVVNYTRSTGATAYAVNRICAKILVKKLSKMSVPFDHAFDQPHKFGIKYRHIVPSPINLFSTQSTIETAKAKKNRYSSERIYTLWWRSKSEVSRFIWALKEYAMYKCNII